MSFHSPKLDEFELFSANEIEKFLCRLLWIMPACLCSQAYAMMLSLSENNPLHGPSQNSLDAWLSMGSGPSETSSYHPLNHV